MPTCADPAARAALAERLRRLAPDARPRWGTLDAPRMLAHLIDALRIGYGEHEPGTPDPPAPRFFATALGRWLVIDAPLPWPKGKAKSPPEWFATAPGDFDADRERLIAELERFDEPRERWGASPIFGALSPAQWGRLSWRHIDHHLRQFGC